MTMKENEMIYDIAKAVSPTYAGDYNFDMEKAVKNAFDYAEKFVAEYKRRTAAKTKPKAKGEVAVAQDGYERFREWFNNQVSVTMIPTISKLTDSRKAALKGIFNEYGKEKVELAIRKVLASDFLTMEWGKVSFDWIFKKANFIKILEGNYDNKPDSTQQQSSGRGQHRNPTAYDLAREILGEPSDRAGERQPTV